MKIEIETSSYNHRRYGKPWIAIVDFTDTKGEFKFGDWVGSHGDSGMLMIKAEPGTIIASGQKDFRQPKNSAPDWYVVVESGGNSRHTDKLQKLDDKVSAFKLWREKALVHTSQPTTT